ncbi:MAG: phosphotransferase [Planctomycetota bacterium]|nr:phosphotransferase [Planctomycetota bacterium]
MLDELIRLHTATFGSPPREQRALPGDGSRRRMVRLVAGDGSTVIGVHGPDALENRAFLSFAASLRDAGLPVPRVHGANEDLGVYLVDDLGDVTLYDALRQERSAERAGANGHVESESRLPPTIEATYRKVLTWLPRFQVLGGRAVDYSAAYPRARYDAQAMQWDCNYFKYDFLKLAHVPFHESALEEDFSRLIRWLGEASGGHFVYRDLQSRNIMIVDGEPWFIDFQGGLQGPLQYDVAKLLYEGKADLPEAARRVLLEHYLDALAEHIPLDRERFLAHFRGFVVLRILQGLGAYGLLGLYERKPQFLARIPHALRDVESLLATGFLPIDVPELRRVFERLAAHDTLRAVPARPNAGLTVSVGSFSYKRGVPADPSGHGGGYVLDCRGLPNPGRLAAYAERSGLDAEVANWLESQSTCTAYRDRIIDLVAEHVRGYQARGFESLQVQFGCTGGQHRSVWMAESLVAALRPRFPEVTWPVLHREVLHWPGRAARPPREA